MSMRQFFVTLGHGAVGWILCAASMFIGMATTTMDTTLIIHAIGAPVFFTGISWVYARFFNYATPLKTALIFVLFVIGIDFFLVALIINQSLDMFTNPLGTWIPFALIFTSSYFTLTYARRAGKARERQQTP